MLQYLKMASRIHEIRVRSNRYVANLQANIISVLESKPVSEKLITLNQEQFLKSRNALGQPLVNRSTGKTTLTPAYARKTGKTKPNLFEKGIFQDSMFMFVPNDKEYFINAKRRLYLSGNYGGSIFGVAPNNEPKAKRVTHKAIGQDYKRKVFAK